MALLLVCLSLLAVAPETVLSFSPISAGRANVLSRQQSDDEAKLLRASIAWSPSDEKSQFGLGGADISHILGDEMSPNSRFRSIRDFLQTEALDRLARLVVAFSPPERSVELEAIEEVSVISIDDNSIDIEAMLCEGDGCVSLSVPISFPKSCSESDDYETCVVDNIGKLDVRASESILNAEWEAKLTDEGINVAYQRKRLRDPNGITYPDWWIPSTVAEDCFTECKSILELMNDDEFSRDVHNLAVHGLKRQGPDDIHIVELAAVSAVGPAGLILRACIRDPENEQIVTREVPFAFPEPASGVESLRTAVLSAVASVES